VISGKITILDTVYEIAFISNYSETDKINYDGNQDLELHLLMQKKLPGYVTKCFLASGFDSEEAIASMEMTGDGPENSMKMMEAYIDKHYSHDPSMHSEFSIGLGGPFEFPPGHKVRICNFVKEVKQNYNKKISPVFNCAMKPPKLASLPENEQQTKQCSRKRLNASKEPQSGSNHKKCRTSIEVAFNETPSSSLTQSENKDYRQVQSSINYWIDGHQSELLRTLNEDHFSIKTVNNGTNVTVYVQCKLCNTPIKLQPKVTKMKGIQHGISNWTKHVTSCYLKKLKADSGQTKLTLKPIHLDPSDKNNSSQSPSLDSVLVKKVVLCSNEKISKRPSQSEIAQKQLLKAASDPCQSHITDYFHILNDIEKLLQANSKLSDLLQQYKKEQSEVIVFHDASFTSILRQLILNAERNLDKAPNHRRHSEILKKFSTALLIYAGPLTYDFIQKNMPEALPSLRTVQRIVCSDYETFSEGYFKFDELALHIEKYKASTSISIGEDATCVISRVDYDSETDKCVGFVLPLNDEGLPLVDSFIAVSFNAMQVMFRSAAKAKYAYVYMAQSLCLKAPPFCLACIGSDNKFTAQHVMLRWKHIYEECSKKVCLY